LKCEIILDRKFKEEYWKRRKEVQMTLIKWGIKRGLAKNINHKHSIGVLEKIIKATKKRHPKNPAKYFLNGLNYSRIKHGRPFLSFINTNITDCKIF